MIQFQGFKPESMPKIANSLGYNGDMQGFQQYLDQNKDKQDMMNQYMQKAQQMKVVSHQFIALGLGQIVVTTAIALAHIPPSLNGATHG